MTGRPLVEQADQGADQPGLALAALAEQDHVVAGEQGPLDLGEHGLVEADDAGQGGLAGGQPGQQVVADLGLDARGARGRWRAARRGCGSEAGCSPDDRTSGCAPAHGVPSVSAPGEIALGLSGGAGSCAGRTGGGG